MFRRRHTLNETSGKAKEAPGIRYLYWGLTGARLARPSHRRNAQPAAQHQPAPTAPVEYDLVEPSPAAEAASQPLDDDARVEGQPTDSTPEQIIARLTAERDAARYERELEADYREALLRDLDVLSNQLKQTQRRLMEMEQAVTPDGSMGERECGLKRELEEARSRIAELESSLALVPPSPLTRGQEGMIDVFLQFVGLQDRHDDPLK